MKDLGKVDWKKFIKDYTSNEAHWYVSKIKEYSESSLEHLRLGLMLLDLCFIDEASKERKEIEHFTESAQLALPDIVDSKLLSKKWNFPTQVFFTSKLDNESLISEMNRARVKHGVGTRYKKIRIDIENGATFDNVFQKYGTKLLNDYAANARNFVSFFKKLGFAWIKNDKGITISDAGYKFINDSNTQELLELQRVKWQIWNPTLPRDRYGAMRILPYFFLLSLLLKLKDSGFEPCLTKHEYTLFVTKAMHIKELDRVFEFVIAYRSLDDKSKSRLLRSLKKITRKTKIAGDIKRSLIEELLDSAGKEIGFFTSNGLCKSVRIGNAEGILLKNEQKARALINSYQKEIRFVDVKNEEEWFHYYGDTSVKPVIKDVVKYYGRSGNYVMIQKTLDELKEADRALAIEIQKTQETILLEKEIEDYYVKNISLVKEDIDLLKNGRQYSTEIGNIDLLAIDKSGRYIVVELKREKADDDAIGQVLRYMGWVHINLANENRVLGIILSQDITNKLKYARKGMQHPEINEVLQLKKHPEEIIKIIRLFKTKSTAKDFDYEVGPAQ